MLLNLTIIKEHLNGYRILQAKTDRNTPRTLKRLARYHPGDPLREDYLYLALPEELPPDPDQSRRCSLLCLGFPPSAYNDWETCEILCFSSSDSANDLFQDVLEIFYMYADYDDRIRQMIIEEKPISEFASLALEIFETPALAYGAFEKILFIAYDPANPESRDYYAGFEEEYFPEDEKSILYQDPEFKKTFEVTGPAYSSSDMYKTQIIYYNIFKRRFSTYDC